MILGRRETLHKTIRIDPATRLEGHARVNLQFADSGTLQKVEFQSFEPPRGFERIFIGMLGEEVPRLAAKICGICYSAHGVAAVQAVENAWEVEPPEGANKIRELMLLANLLHSHTLHFAMLAMPDLICGSHEKKNVIGLISKDKELVEAAMYLRMIAQKTTEILGARQINPATIVPGGMTKSPTNQEVERIATIVDEAKNFVRTLKSRAETLIDTRTSLIREFAGIESNFLCLKQNGHLSLCNRDLELLRKDGQVLTMKTEKFSELVKERVIEFSFTKRPYLEGGVGLEDELIRVGPLARVNRCDWKNDLALKFEQVFSKPTQSTLAYNIARVIEIEECVKRMENIIEGGIHGPFRVPVKPREGSGAAIVEAPRGVLFHYYSTDDQGIVTEANVITPTGLNAFAIEKSAESAARIRIGQKGSEDVTREDLDMIEMAVRAYDPCVSCSVHVTQIKEGEKNGSD